MKELIGKSVIMIEASNMPEGAEIHGFLENSESFREFFKNRTFLTIRFDGYEVSGQDFEIWFPTAKVVVNAEVKDKGTYTDVKIELD